MSFSNLLNAKPLIFSAFLLYTGNLLAVTMTAVHIPNNAFNQRAQNMKKLVTESTIMPNAGIDLSITYHNYSNVKNIHLDANKKGQFSTPDGEYDGQNISGMASYTDKNNHAWYCTSMVVAIIEDGILPFKCYSLTPQNYPNGEAPAASSLR